MSRWHLRGLRPKHIKKLYGVVVMGAAVVFCKVKTAENFDIFNKTNPVAYDL